MLLQPKYTIEELVNHLLDRGYYCLTEEDQRNQIYSCRSILVELIDKSDMFSKRKDYDYKIYDKICGSEFRSGGFYDGEHFKKYILEILIGKNGLSGLDENQLIKMYDHSQSDFRSIINKHPIYRYFIEVYKFYEYKSVLSWRRPGKDDYFDDTTTTKYVVRFLNNFISDKEIDLILPEHEIINDRSTGYGGYGSRNVSLTFDLEKTKLVINKLNSENK